MITDDYVSFEVAKLLKRKGFNKIPYVLSIYDKNGNIHWGIYDEEWYIRPTHQTACKWLREEHNLMISINFSYFFNSYTYSIKYITKCKITYAGKTESYEEAVEAALKYVLENLI